MKVATTAVTTVAAGLVLGVQRRSDLRRWGLRMLAHGGPVMMNVTTDTGSITVKDAKFGYFYRNTHLNTPSAAMRLEGLQ